MRIDQLAMEYGRSAELLRGRITELEHALRETGDPETQERLDRRLRPLRAMYRDTRAVSRALERYAPRYELRSREGCR